MYFAGYKENDILNKILFILLIGFFMVLIFVSPSFASIDVKYNDEYTYTIPYDGTEDYHCYLFVNPICRNVTAKNNYSFDCIISSTPLQYVGNTRFVCKDGGSYNSFGSNPYLLNCNGSLDKILPVLQNDIDHFYDSYFGPNSNNGKFVLSGYSSFELGSDFCNSTLVCATNSVIYDEDNNIIAGTIPFNAPYFMTVKENLETGKFDTLDINAGDLDGLNDKFGLFIYDITSKHFDSIFSSVSDLAKDVTPVSYMVLDGSSSYRVMMDTDAIYTIPRDKLGINLENGKRYQFALINLDDASVYNRVNFTVGGLTAEEELKNKQDETNKKLEDQTNAIKESNETNKNIFERIGEMLSYINPFSENFFVYKLIELLVDAIKSLFIPSDDFFGNYFTELKDWFSERLGFLFYPFQLIIDILNKILNINFSEPIFNIPDLIEPFTGSKIMSATTFNLNSMIESGIFKTIHDIYLVCVDAFITFELVNLFKRKYEEVTTK